MSVPPVVLQYSEKPPYTMRNVNSNFLYSPFLPNMISDLAIWLDGNDINGDGTTPTVGPISSWANKASNSITCTQLTNSNIPSFVSPGVQFINHNDGTTVNGFDLNYQAPKDVETIFLLFNYQFPSSAPSSDMNILYPNNNRGRQVYVQKNTTLITSELNNTILLSNGVVNENQPNLINSLINNGTVSHYIDGTFKATGSGPLFTEGSITYLGTDNYTGSNGLNGTIYEVLIYSNALKNEERYEVESYLYHKWNSFLLDPTSPYYTTPYSNYNYSNLNSNMFQQPYSLTTDLTTLNSNNYPLIRNLLRFPNRLSNVSFS